MKNLFFTITLIIGLNSFAQEKTQSEYQKPEYQSDLVKFDSDSNTVELTGNVNFKTEIIELQNAEKILFNKETMKLL